MTGRIVIKTGTNATSAAKGASLSLKPLRSIAAAVARLTADGSRRVVVVAGGTAAHMYINTARLFAASEATLALIGEHIVEANTLIIQSAIAHYGCDVAPRVAHTVAEVDEALARHAICVAGVIPGAISTDSIAALIAEHIGADLLIFVKKGLIFRETPDRVVAEITATDLLQMLRDKNQRAGDKAPIDMLAAVVLRRCGVRAAVISQADAARLPELLERDTDLRQSAILPM